MLTRLMVLGFLFRQPMHGYEIQQFLTLNQTEQWAGILPGSIYHALKKMEGEGLVRVDATEHTGHRTRAIYAITEAGGEEFRRLLREAWRTPGVTLPQNLYTALSFLDDLPRAEVLTAIDEQVAGMEAGLARWNEGEVKKAEAMGGLPPIMTLMFANGRAHMEADIAFLKAIRAMLPTLPIKPIEIPKLEGM